MLKNGSYLLVHFSDEQKKKLEKFAIEVHQPQSRIVEQILEMELDRYIYDWRMKKNGRCN